MPALHRDRDATDYRDHTLDDREISLGTGTILAIFFALALVCAVFFGLGYSMGRKSAQPAPIASAATDVSGSSSVFNGFKPAAGNTGTQPAAAAKKMAAAQPSSNADPDATIVTTPVSPSNSQSEAIPNPRQTAFPRREPAQQTTAAAVVRDATRPPSSALPAQQSAAMPATNPNGTSIVQVAAVSHQEDADVLISALKKRGYAVFLRQEPQDHLLHVQVGPFATRKDAEAMRQRLLSDGYNAIVK